MTEPRVEAGDRALETARKIHQKCVMEAPDELWLDVPKAAALIQSAMNAQVRELRHAVSCMDRSCKRCNELAKVLAERGEAK